MSSAMPALRRIAASPWSMACCGIIVLGAALRFSTLDLQSYRYDEAVTVGRVLHANFFDTFAAVPRSESTPPLYYMVAWALVEALRHRRSLDAVALGALRNRLDPGRLPRRAGPSGAAARRPDRRRDRRGQPGADLVLPGCEGLRIGLPPRRALLPLLRPRPPQRHRPRPRLVGRLLGVGAGDPLLRRLPDRARGGAAPARAQPARRCAGDPGDPGDGCPARADRAQAVRTRPRRLDRLAADRRPARTGRRQVGRQRQRRRARSTTGRRGAAGGARGARGAVGGALDMARRPKGAPRRRGRRRWSGAARSRCRCWPRRSARITSTAATCCPRSCPY